MRHINPRFTYLLTYQDDSTINTAVCITIIIISINTGQELMALGMGDPAYACWV